MREVIQTVLEAEAEARRMVEAGRGEGACIVSEAQRQAEELLAQAGRQARMEAEGIVAAAVQVAEREKRDRLARAARDIEAEVRLDETTRVRAVEAVVRCVCGRA